jgi:thiol-disulfide isomerase/thioredoxin
LDAELGDEVKLEEGGEPLLDLGEEVRNLERNSEMPEKPISAPIVPKAKPTKVPYKDRQLEEACYANRYPDVKSYYKIDPNNITEKNKEDLLQHWTVYGKREGRNPGCGAGRGRGMGKSLTLYYAEWCHFCKVIMPIWKKLRVPGVEIRMVEEKQNNELRVEGYPTIIYRNGNQMEKYSGPRTKAGIEKFLKNKL